MNAYYFWLQSSRGTAEFTLTRLSKNLSQEDIQSEVENWCDRFGAWHVSENCVYYGWAKATQAVRNRVARYIKYKAQRYKRVDLLIAKKITTTQYNQWAKKNKKFLAFPFK